MERPELKRPALGNEVPLGALYDARSDTFLPNLFVEELPDNVVDVKPNVKSTAQLSKAATIRDKLTALGITPELGASILAGLAPINVYAPYLNNRNGYQFSAAQASLLYTITTVKEEFKPYATSNRSYRIPVTMDMPTHIVTGITWGAQFLVTAHHTTSSPDDLARQQERLDSVFENLKSAALHGSSQLSVSSDEPALHKKESSVFENCDVSILGNVLPHSSRIPTSCPSPRAIIDHLRTYLVATNGGKGKQIQYTLMPLAPMSHPPFIEITGHAVHQPRAIFLEGFIRLLNDWADARQQCMEYAARCERNGNDAASTPGRVFASKSRVRAAQLAEGKFKKGFGEILQALRNGRAKDLNLDLLLIFAENNVVSPKGVLSMMIRNDAVDGQDLKENATNALVTYASFREKVIQRV